MIGEPDAGKPHVRFDEGVQETCDIAARLCPTLRQARFCAQLRDAAPFRRRDLCPRDLVALRIPPIAEGAAVLGQSAHQSRGLHADLSPATGLAAITTATPVQA